MHGGAAPVPETRKKVLLEEGWHTHEDSHVVYGSRKICQKLYVIYITCWMNLNIMTSLLVEMRMLIRAFPQLGIKQKEYIRMITVRGHGYFLLLCLQEVCSNSAMN